MQPDELRRTADGYVRGEVARGRMTCAMIVSGVVEHLDGLGDPADLHALAWDLVGPAFADHLAAQATWPERTDSDRLTDAFRALDAAGIVAREDFACCQNCGTGEIGAEVTDDAPARGYVFYHGQDAERAVQGDGVRLAFGRFEQPPTAEIGAEIAAALRTAGLTVDWDGSPEQRIHVPMRWARRRHGRMAAYPEGGQGGPAVTVRYLPDRRRVDPPMSAATLARLELPWLPDDTTVRVDDGRRTVTIRREKDRLIDADGRSVHRFAGRRLLSDSAESGNSQRGDGSGRDNRRGGGEPGGSVEVTFSSLPSGPHQFAGRPMEPAEILDVLRRLPTRTGSWLSVLHPVAGCVQVSWDDGRLWLETPRAADETTTGKHTSLDEAERVLTVLLTEHRNTVGELPGVTVTAW